MKRILIALLLIALPAAAVQTNLPSAYSNSSTTAIFLPLDTTIIVTTTAESWFALISLTANNTTSAIQTVTVTLHESVSAVTDETINVSLKPGTSTVQLPKQYQGSDLGLGSHTFRVRVNQSTNSPIIYQTSSYLGVYNNTGTGGVTGGGGDVTGPASSLENDIAVFADTTGKVLKDPGFWGIDVSGNLVTPGGNLGIGDASPDARFDIDETSGDGATNVSCAGSSLTASVVCNRKTSTATGTGTGLTKIVDSISTSGAFTGSGTHVIGTFYDMDGGTNNDAIYVLTGNIAIASGKIGIGDDTPTASIDVVDNSTANGLLVSKTAATNAPTQTAVFANNTTGGDGSFAIKSAVQATSGGSFNGVSNALLLNATGGTQGNTALAVLAGDITMFGAGDLTVGAGNLTVSAGQITADTTDNSQVAVDAGCTQNGGSTRGCLTAVATGSGSTSVTAVKAAAVHTNGGATAMQLDVTGQDVFAMDLHANSESDGTVSGMRIVVDGNGNTISTGLLVDVSDSADPEAIRVTGGNVDYGAANQEGFAYLFATKQTVFNNGPAPATNATVEVYATDDADTPALHVECDQDAGGEYCQKLVVAGDGTGDFQGMSIEVAGGGGSANAIGLVVSASGGGGNNISFNVSSGDVIYGIPGIAEQYHWNGTAADGDANHTFTGAGSRIAVDIVASGTGPGPGAALRTTLTGDANTATVGAQISNGQTSSTNAINKTGLQVNSTGSFTGTGAKNAGVQASATGATDAGSNYAFWALQGGVRGPWFIYDPLDDEPFACDSDHKGATAVDGPLGALCICSDSDGSSFEWEQVGLPLVTCTF